MIERPKMQKETLEVLYSKLKRSQNATEELSIFKTNLEKHLNHLDGIEPEQDEAHTALMEKILNKPKFTSLMTQLARIKVCNE